MLSTPCQMGRGARSVHLLWKRSYNFKKLDIQALKNPQVEVLRKEKLQRKEKQGVLQRLIDKRTSDYKEYFSRASDISVVKRPRHTSYDHIGQKRALHLSKILRAFVVDRIGSGEIGDVLAGKNFQLTNIVVPVDLNRIEILWWSPENEAPHIEDLLKTAGDELKTAIRHAQLLPSLPPVLFKRDNSPTKRDHINSLLDAADTGLEETTTPEVPKRQDLYDSDRTVILRKLAVDEDKLVHGEDRVDNDELSVEQVQRRMKAFALTKRMKRVQEQRSAVYGIMAIERAREKQEHFTLHETDDVELGESNSGNKK